MKMTVLSAVIRMMAWLFPRSSILEAMQWHCGMMDLPCIPADRFPKELKTVQVEHEIISTFYDENNIGLVFKNDSKDKQYTMQVYASDGKTEVQQGF